MPSQLEQQGPIKLRQITQRKLPVKMDKRLIFKWFPIVSTKETYLQWEQRDVYKGVQNARGLGGTTGAAKRPSVNAYRVPPGYYGDHFTITEADLINLRKVGDWEQLKTYEEQFDEASEVLTERYLNRLELSCAQILTTGGYTASNINGQQYHQDVFNIQQFTPGTLFSDLANSTPLNYFRDVIAQMRLGVSVTFKDGALLMSRPTFNLIMKNTNANDAGGKRLAVGSNINSLEDVNKYLAADDLPVIEIVDENYYVEGASIATRYFTNGKIVVVGHREDGEQIGEYRLTPAAQNQNMQPGEWFTVEDRRMKDPYDVTLRMGHNGGPVVYHPEAMAIINAAAPF